MKQEKDDIKQEYFSLEETLQGFADWKNYLLRQWKLILIVGIAGGLLGVVVSFLYTPKYTAHLSFSLVEKGSGSSGLADLASSFGFLGGGSGGSTFSGDNLLEIMKSQSTIERTLLSTVPYNNQSTNLVNIYLDFSGMKEKFAKSAKPELQNLTFPVGQMDNFARVQDSVLAVIYDRMMKSGALSINRVDKKMGLVNVEFVSEDEQYSKLFVEKLMDVTNELYTETRTGQLQKNIDKMQYTADSIKALYEASMYGTVSVPQANINPAMQFETVPRMKQESNARLYGGVYAEVLKNLETLKLDLARETPIFQTIDHPKYPLKKKKIGLLKGVVLGGFLAGLLALMYLSVQMVIRRSLHGKKLQH